MKQLIIASFAAATIVASMAVGAVADSMRPLSAGSLSGVISSINGKYGLTVRDNLGSLDSVTLHNGTIIDPTGLQLKPGMPVTIVGHADGSTFDANAIVAPVEAANRSPRTDDGRPRAIAPVYVPRGTFQTHGPSALGGG